jgi:hypothetical protein
MLLHSSMYGPHAGRAEGTPRLSSNSVLSKESSSVNNDGLRLSPEAIRSVYPATITERAPDLFLHCPT